MIWRMGAPQHYTSVGTSYWHASFSSGRKPVRVLLPEGNSIPNEIEIKLAMKDAPAARKMLARLGAKPVRTEIAGKEGRVHELNTLIDTPDGGFARHGQLLRLRIETGPSKNRKAKPRAILTYKGPAEAREASRFKIR